MRSNKLSGKGAEEPGSRQIIGDRTIHSTNQEIKQASAEISFMSITIHVLPVVQLPGLVLPV
ncbi:hypothetical protein GmarT_34700 [Gimesia maris]|uniref:Uncharacterized protein n=1 Tax=Gimesia maris TaxID=122 RepID=A0ABX5YPR4_9PLAN|nr:hypothetical protein CA11_33870 [Gimesia maris]QEG17588.1 hypothetical protein GmarT_34700 [Gimesia maris]